MTYYLSVGLGIYMAFYVLDYANPAYDQSFFGYIAAFLMHLFAWPFVLLGVFLKSVEMRKYATELNMILEEAEKKALTLMNQAEETKENDEPKDPR